MILWQVLYIFPSKDELAGIMPTLCEMILGVWPLWFQNNMWTLSTSIFQKMKFWFPFPGKPLFTELGMGNYSIWRCISWAGNLAVKSFKSDKLQAKFVDDSLWPMGIVFLVGMFSDLDSVGVACTPKKVRLHILFPIIIKVESSCQVKGNYPPNKRGNLSHPSKNYFWVDDDFPAFSVGGICFLVRLEGNIFRYTHFSLKLWLWEDPTTHPLSWFASLKNLLWVFTQTGWVATQCLFMQLWGGCYGVVYMFCPYLWFKNL